MISEAADLAGVTGQAIADRGKALGLTWDLRPCTVETSDPLTVTFDGDTAIIGAVSLIGVLAPTTRVMGLLIPPGGTFIVGYNDAVFADRLGGPVNYSAVGAAGSTTSATYVNLPNVPFVTVEKQFDSADTNIEFVMTTSIFSSGGVNVGVGFGVNLTGGTGTDVDLITRTISSPLIHVDFAMTKLLTGLAPGTYTLLGRWKRTASAFTLQMDSGDWTTILAREVWAR